MTCERYPITVQKWKEKERGWGERPDGYSLHLNDADRLAYIAEYWQSMPDTVQDEYSLPDGTPYQALVDTETFIKIAQTKNGMIFIGNPPGSGGIDGFVYARQK